MKNIETIKIRTEIEQLFANLDTEIYTKLQLTKNLYAVVDKYFEKDLIKLSWCAQETNSGVYGCTSIKGERYYLQRYICEKLALRSKKPIKQISFKNKLTLDCRLKNLINGGRSKAMQNRRPKTNTTSTYKGVFKRPVDTKWSSNLRDKKLGYIYLGTHNCEVRMAKIYDAAVRELHGKNVYQNFPNEKHVEYIEIANKYIERRKERLKQKEKEAEEVNLLFATRVI